MNAVSFTVVCLLLLYTVFRLGYNVHRGEEGAANGVDNLLTIVGLIVILIVWAKQS